MDDLMFFVPLKEFILHIDENKPRVKLSLLIVNHKIHLGFSLKG